MKKIFIALLTVAIAPVAMAGKGETKAVVCHFTEPFIKVDMTKVGEKFEITVNNVDDQGSEVVSHPINFLVAETKESLIVTYGYITPIPDSQDVNIEKMTLTMDKTIEGNDGMSDEVFDWQGTLELTPDFTVVGGCNFEL